MPIYTCLTQIQRDRRRYQPGDELEISEEFRAQADRLLRRKAIALKPEPAAAPEPAPEPKQKGRSRAAAETPAEAEAPKAE